MTGFEFKRTNQEATPHYHPPAPAAGGSAGSTDRAGSNTGGTTRSRRPQTLASGVGGSDLRWNPPKDDPLKITLPILSTYTVYT
jgi:hypothetical protein